MDKPCSATAWITASLARRLRAAVVSTALALVANAANRLDSRATMTLSLSGSLSLSSLVLPSLSLGLKLLLHPLPACCTTLPRAALLQLLAGALVASSGGPFSCLVPEVGVATGGLASASAMLQGRCSGEVL